MKDEITIEHNCLFWGYRIILPKSLRNMYLKEHHFSHMGILKIKSLARAYVWWPSLKIENLAKSCLSCG